MPLVCPASKVPGGPSGVRASIVLVTSIHGSCRQAAERGLVAAPTVSTALVMQGLEVRSHLDTCILCIGGSDSSAGAGIQADIKTARALQMHACCAVTCVTAQNTLEFNACQLVEPATIIAQVDAVFADFDVAAVKVGMLASPEAAIAVAAVIERYRKGNRGLPVVVDPVLAATTSKQGAREVVARAIARYLVPLASVVTPNLDEALMLANCCQQILSGATTADNKTNAAPQQAADEVIAAWAARTLIAAGAQSVLVKGGHGSDPTQVRDLLFSAASDLSLSVSSEEIAGDGDIVPNVRVMVGPGCRDAFMSRPVAYSAPRLEGEFHGTGCVLSTAIACRLACGVPLAHAIGDARALLRTSLESAQSLGHGSRIIDPS